MSIHENELFDDRGLQTRRQHIKTLFALAGSTTTVGVLIAACAPAPDTTPAKDIDAELVINLQNLLEYKEGMNLEEFANNLHEKTYGGNGKWGTLMTVGQDTNNNGNTHNIATGVHGQEVSTVKWDLKILFRKPTELSRNAKSIADIKAIKGITVVHGTFQTAQSLSYVPENNQSLVDGTGDYFKGSKTKKNILFLNYLPPTIQLKDAQYNFTGTTVDNPVNAYSVTNFNTDTTFVVLNMNILQGYADAYGLSMQDVIIMALANEKANFLAEQIEGKNTETLSEAPSLFAGYLARKLRVFREFFLGKSSTKMASVLADQAATLKRIGP